MTPCSAWLQRPRDPHKYSESNVAPPRRVNPSAHDAFRSSLGAYHRLAASRPEDQYRYLFRHFLWRTSQTGIIRRGRNCCAIGFTADEIRSCASIGTLLPTFYRVLDSHPTIQLSHYPTNLHHPSRPILNRLRKVRRLDLVTVCQVRNRAREFQDAMERAGAHLHLLHR